MRVRIAIAIALVSSAARAVPPAQTPPPAAIDTSNFATKSDVAAVAATVPTPMLAVPPMEVPGGAAGTAGTYRTGTAVQPRITRMVLAQTTGSDGTKTVAWSPDLPSVPGVIVIPHVTAAATLPPFCYPIDGLTTVSGAKVKCFVAQGITVSILGATLAPLTAAGAGIVFDAFAVPAS